MAENSKIEWTDHTINLWWGCSKVHTGCKNCYAEHLSDTRLQNNLWGEKTGRKMVVSAFKNLDKFQRNAEKENKKVKVFVGSMMDIFEDSKPLINQDGTFTTTEDLSDELFYRILNNKYENIIFLFLTKRPQNINKKYWSVVRNRDNCWFGTSISDQRTMHELVPELINAKVKNRFLSIEPQVSEIDLCSYIIKTHERDFDFVNQPINWIIQGGESGHNKRYFNIDWAYKISVQAGNSRIPYFFKQIDKVQPIPSDLMIRQLPKSMQ